MVGANHHHHVEDQSRGGRDLEKDSYQLVSAKEAYKEGKCPGMVGQFWRNVINIVRKAILDLILGDGTGAHIHT
ncbi:hypothetical protein NPIL_230391 [Nephila pilipes]|uniref:Uncharacterized protein n=1 Tax=Nephila pilipes TaxID=299642 RepID=A0A8X6QAY9_NEPPI|nr:hypothetical protein NPIL_230391 [Nephila pilipes]